GTEDQGWVAHFVRRALQGEAVTVYGDGHQVRDLLYIDDLVEALLLAQRESKRIQGSAFNIGGGPENAISVNEVIARAETLTGRRLERRAGPWRVGDQRYYVSDTRRFRAATGWRPRTNIESGLQRLIAYVAGACRPPSASRAV